MAAKPRNPYEPFTTAIRIGASLYVVGLLLSLLSTVFGWGSFSDLGDQAICVENTGLVIGTDIVPPDLFRPGVVPTPQAMSLCVNHATVGQQILNALMIVPGWVCYGVALALLWWLLNGAKQHGPFHAANASRVRFIGWWLIVGGTVAATVQTVARNLLIGTMMQPSQAPGWFDSLPTVQASVILTGLGLLVIARILKVGAQMHDDLAGTV